MKNNIAFATTIFPIDELYIDDFFSSLSNQTYNDFDLVILNDGYGSLDKYKIKYPELNIIELIFSSTPALNREHCLRYIKEAGYEVVIFGDSDDTFSPRRIEHSVHLLDSVDIVVNDVSLFDKQGMIEANYMLNCIPNNSIIEKDFILEKNIFGLSNTALNMNIVEFEDINFDENLIALDWYLFSILVSRGYKAIFTSEIITNYRQHGINTIGMGAFTKEKMKELLLIKQKHYQLMVIDNPVYSKFLKKISAECTSIHDEEYLQELVQHNNDTVMFPLWWEYKTLRS